jgi:hemoglobin/transferrin/lactoferrin receptor protein
MKKNTLFIVFLFAFIHTSFSQVLTIVEEDTQLPLEMVSITSIEPKATQTTNIKGQADITNFKGSDKINISLFGYNPINVSYAYLDSIGFKVSLVSNFGLDEVIVSATKWNQTKKDVPNRVISISSKDVALQNPQTAADLLGASGEVTVQKSQQGGGSPMIRGFSANRLLYTIDGVRMNTAIFRGGNLQNVISLDPLAIENTEVFFGPGSIIYGSDAIGGVMAFRTLTPTFTTDTKPFIMGKALTRFSSANNEKTGHFDINVGWKKFAMVTSFTTSDFDDLKMGTNGPDDYLRHFYVQRMDSIDRVVTNDNPLIQRPTSYSQINMMQKFRFSPNEKWDFQYAFHYSETSEYSRYDRLIEQQSNGLPRSAVWNYGPQKWMMNQVSIQHNQANLMYDNVSIRLAQQYFEESRIDRNFSGGNRFRLRTQQEEVLALSANVDFVKTIKKLKVFYGFESIQNDVNSVGSAVNISTGDLILVSDRYPKSTWNSNAVYLNGQYKFSEKMMVQGGVRYNLFKIESDFTRHLSFFPFDFTTSELKNDALTGSLGMVYSPDETWRIALSASTGFRAPNIDDIGKIFDFAAGEVVVPNTSLAAEYAYNGELNVAKVIGKKVKVDLTGYYTQLENSMVRREFQVNGQDSILYDGTMSRVYAIQNAAYANVYGFHAGIEVKLPQGFGISSLYNYQLGVEEMDNGEVSRSRHAAPAFGVTRLTYSYNKLRMQLYAHYTAEVSFENLNPEEQQKPAIYAKDADGNPYSPSWYTLNFKSMYQFSTHFTVSAGLENITNQRYRPYSSGLVAPGRNVVLSLRATF